MADESPLARELNSLLEALPRAHLIEISRRAALGGFAAVCRQQLGGQTLESGLASLYPDFSGAQIAAAAHEMALCAVRNMCWSSLLSQPDESKVQIRCSNPKIAHALRTRTGPAIIVFWHFGASSMMPLGLQRIGVPSLIFARKVPPPWFRRAVSPEMKMVVINDNPRLASLALKNGLDRLKKNGVVVLAVDGSQGQQDFTVPFLGRRIALGRGVAVLARLTGAPIIPSVITWGEKDWSLDFRLFDPLPLPAVASMKPEAWDLEVLTIVGRRFEEIARAFPGQTRLERLTHLVKAPRA